MYKSKRIRRKFLTHKVIVLRAERQDLWQIKKKKTGVISGPNILSVHCTALLLLSPFNIHSEDATHWKPAEWIVWERRKKCTSLLEVNIPISRVLEEMDTYEEPDISTYKKYQFFISLLIQTTENHGSRVRMLSSISSVGPQ